MAASGMVTTCPFLAELIKHTDPVRRRAVKKNNSIFLTSLTSHPSQIGSFSAGFVTLVSRSDDVTHCAAPVGRSPTGSLSQAWGVKISEPTGGHAESVGARAIERAADADRAMCVVARKSRLDTVVKALARA